MSGVFLSAAMIGGSLFVLQMLLTSIGWGDSDTDVHTDVEHGDALWSGVLSFRAIVAAVTVFGLSGLLARSLGTEPLLATAVASVAGIATMFVVAACVGALLKLADDGTFRLEQAIGSPGVVYIGLPAPGAGLGKVHLRVQGRTVELEAAAADGPLTTGTPIVVTGVIGPNIVEVVHQLTTQETHV